MPEPDAGVIKERQSLVAALRKLLPEDCVIDDERGLRPFECDGPSAPTARCPWWSSCRATPAR